MIRRLAGAVLATAAGGTVLTAAGTAQAAPAAAPAAPVAPAAGVDFTGIVALSNCSGSLVRGPRSRDGDKALVLTNGHCLETGMPAAGEVIADRPSTRSFTLLDPSGRRTLGTLGATRIEYATMTDTDVAVYRLGSTYAQIRAKYGIGALRLSLARPRTGEPIRVVSGYWKRIYSCKIDGFAYRMREAGWTWKDSIRYTPECATIGGTSGSPIVDARTRQVVGVNNTGNEDGERCTLNNPCEVGRDGRVTVRKGINYGQQTYHLARCLGAGNDVVLGGTCALPRPSAYPRRPSA
ncbi:serine protease [Actinomadura viridis]|uniref:V8-like Glu-specific endopeptidase n=1 Tax=Actinomadura viridis TaxID=58110 RepID=A0A931DLP1_9ACTN|nr:serine protease [Actinomadura viridis]MBG6089355.1 V8-like Glu-specific endopeptidase [Actinomadura viridis]